MYPLQWQDYAWIGGFLTAVCLLWLFWRARVRQWAEEDRLESERRHQEEAIAIAYAPTPIVPASEARHPLDAVPYPITPSGPQCSKALGGSVAR
jgi:hypothetical protein